MKQTDQIFMEWYDSKSKVTHRVIKDNLYTVINRYQYTISHDLDSKHNIIMMENQNVTKIINWLSGI